MKTRSTGHTYNDILFHLLSCTTPPHPVIIYDYIYKNMHGTKIPSHLAYNICISHFIPHGLLYMQLASGMCQTSCCHITGDTIDASITGQLNALREVYLPLSAHVKM